MGQDVLKIMGSSKLEKVKTWSNLGKDEKTNFTQQWDLTWSNKAWERKEEDAAQVYTKWGNSYVYCGTEQKTG